MKLDVVTDGHQDLRDFYLTCDGRKLGDNCVIRPGKCVWLVPRIVGGKGGFGSMLRAIGAQIEKTTNREACRDLSGRRLRDINEEKRLKKWIAKQADAERGREQRRKERLARMLVVPKHEFNDPNYYKQRSQITDTVEDALSQGLSAGPSGESEKRKPNLTNKPAKRVKIWTGVDDELCESSDADSENSHKEINISTEPSSDADSSIDEETTVILPPDQETETESDQTSNGDANINVSVPEIPAECVSSEVQNEKQEKLPDAHTQMDIPCASETLQFDIDQKESKLDEHIPLDLENFNCVAELEKLGLERLKVALAERGLKCGGTLKERAKRLFSIKGLDLKDVDPSLIAKPVKKHKKAV